MKVRDSGMPDADYWDSLFDVSLALDRLELNSACRDIVEFGCGYGTFTLPAARRISGTCYALDIDEAAIMIAEESVRKSNLKNIIFARRDFIEQGTGLLDATMDYAMVFNILHHERPVEILREAYRVLAPGGTVGVIHWVYSDKTPRGPTMDIRPKPENLYDNLIEAGFIVKRGWPIDCPPWHYGLIGIKR